MFWLSLENLLVKKSQQDHQLSNSWKNEFSYVLINFGFQESSLAPQTKELWIKIWGGSHDIPFSHYFAVGFRSAMLVTFMRFMQYSNRISNRIGQIWPKSCSKKRNSHHSHRCRAMHMSLQYAQIPCPVGSQSIASNPPGRHLQANDSFSAAKCIGKMVKHDKKWWKE